MILEKYNLHGAAIEKVNSGTESNAMMVQFKTEKFILRRVRSLEQAKLEYETSLLLKGRKIVPEICLNAENKPYVESNREIYNLQRFVEGGPIRDINRDIIEEVAKQVANVHRALSACEMSADPMDRFSLGALTEQCKGKEDILIECLEQKKIDVRQFLEKCNELIALDEIKEQLIHGDLGFWNMILSNHSVYIIDFGECRMGSIYTDMAAVTASILSKTSTSTDFVKLRDVLLNSYKVYNCTLDLDKLFDYVMLWYLRGIYAVLLSENEENSKKKRIMFFLSEIKRYSLYSEVCI